MILEKLWKKEIPENTISEIEEMTKDMDTSKKQAVLNGSYNDIPKWTPVQYLLFHDPLKHLKTLYYFVEKGVDLCFLSRKGVNLFHLFVLLFFYNQSFQNVDYVYLFLDFFRYHSPQETVFIKSSSEIYTLMDLLVECQKQEVVSVSFFSPFLELEHKKLPTDLYNLLYISLLSYGCKFYRNYPNHEYDTIHVGNCVPFMIQYPIFFQYVLNRFKTPRTISPTELQRRLYVLGRLQSKLNIYLKRVDENIPIGEHVGGDERIYLNIFLSESCFLRDYEFFSIPSSPLTFFHKNYLSVLLKTKMNPFTRGNLTDSDIQLCLKEIHEWYNFPICTLQDSLFFYPYLFEQIQIKDELFLCRTILEFVSSFFSIHHPYNQIGNLLHLKSFQIQYFGKMLSTETSFFPKFKKIIKKPSLDNLIKILFFYCMKNIRYVNIMYFLIEEFLQDLKCYEKLEKYMNDPELHSFYIYDEYYTRFGTESLDYVRKFIRNLESIHKFNQNI